MKLTLKVRQIPGLTRLNFRKLALLSREAKFLAAVCHFLQTSSVGILKLVFKQLMYKGHAMRSHLESNLPLRNCMARRV